MKQNNNKINQKEENLIEEFPQEELLNKKIKYLGTIGDYWITKVLQ